jgi:hypothetical protein
MFRPAPAIFRVVVIKYKVKLFKNSVIKVKKEDQVFSKKSLCKIGVKMGPVGICVVCLVCDSPHQADNTATNRYVYTQSQHLSLSYLYIMFWMFYK